MLTHWTVHVTHPRYFGLFNPSVRQAGILADALAALFNPQLAAWSHAPAANEIEKHTLSALTRTLGLPENETFANFTTGGAEANQTALLSALAHHFPESDEAGVAGLTKRPAIYLTGETHHSFVKIARMAGFGTSALHEIPTLPNFKMDTQALLSQIKQDRQNGWYPLMIIGTAGTTSAGTIDPLPELAKIAKTTKAWFHVDGAWGATAVLSPRLKKEFVGIEEADSVTWDAHKWMSVPMGAGMFFTRHQEAVLRAFDVSTSYMPDQVNRLTLDPYTSSVQWSRRTIGLKVFMALAELGLDGYAALIEHQADMGDLLREKLVGAGWMISNDTRLPVVCFTRPEIIEGRFTTKDVLEIIYQKG